MTETQEHDADCWWRAKCPDCEWLGSIELCHTDYYGETCECPCCGAEVDVEEVDAEDD